MSGNCLNLNGEKEKAKELYLEAIGVEADCVEAIYNLGAQRVRCGVLWYAVVWCAVVWCAVVWSGAVWCSVVWCGVAPTRIRRAPTHDDCVFA
jgi:hypothetical protein